MNFSADVIISGAGPAGSLAAYDLSRAGFRVLVLEKEQFPRYKVCGAGLTHKILGEIPFSIEPVLENTIYHVRFSMGFGEVFTRQGEVPVMYCTHRTMLDQFLLQKAEAAGTRSIMGEKVTGIRQMTGYVEVTTTSSVYTSRVLIGADGASSLVARMSGLRRNIGPGLAWEAELKAPEEDLHRFRETIFLDWGTFPGGYGWVFPKKDHFSAGVGGPAVLSRQMMPYYHKFLLSTGIHFGETLSLKSWPIPVRRKRGDFHAGLVMVAGDAGGLTDPLTGEGIWYAVKSGRLAAESAIAFLNGQRPDLSAYSSSVNATLMEEIRMALRIRDVFNTAPGRIHRLVRDNDRVWRAFGKILRGERFYSDVRGGFGRWSFLWGIICAVSRFLYKYREAGTRRRDREITDAV